MAGGKVRNKNVFEPRSEIIFLIVSSVSKIKVDRIVCNNVTYTLLV